MPFRLNLQWKILLLEAVWMSLIIVASSYRQGVRTRSIIEKDHHENAMNKTLALANRISKYDYFSNLKDLHQEIDLVAGSRPDFKQIDVYQNTAGGIHLIATTAPASNSLTSLSTGETFTAEPLGPSSEEMTRENSHYWLITTPVSNSQHSGLIRALVLKSYHHQLVNSLHRQYNLALLGVVVASAVLLYLPFCHFFRPPVRAIVQTMAAARNGNLAHRGPVG